MKNGVMGRECGTDRRQKKHIKFSLKILKGRGHLKDVLVYRKIVFKYILKMLHVRVWPARKQGPVFVSYLLVIGCLAESNTGKLDQANNC